MQLLFILILAGVTGILTKLADDIADSKLALSRFYGLATAVGYGALIGFVASVQGLTSLWLGAILGMILAGKIDHLYHVIAIGVAGSTFLFFGPAHVDITFLFFTVFAYLDEKIQDRATMMHKHGAGPIERFLTLELCALIVSALTNNWLVFLSLLSFDTGYFSSLKWLSKYMTRKLGQLSIDTVKNTNHL